MSEKMHVSVEEFASQRFELGDLERRCSIWGDMDFGNGFRMAVPLR